jgi:hypothetical protein
MSVLGSFRTYLNLSPDDIATMAAGPLVVTANLSAAQAAAGIQPKQDGSADTPDDAVLMNASDSTFKLHARYYMAGIPDVLVRENPLGPWIVGIPSWNTLFQQYKNILLGNTPTWGFLTQIPDNVANYKSVQCLGVAGDPTTGYLMVTCPTLPGGVGIGSVLQLRLFQMANKNLLGLNGLWQVNNATATAGNSTYTLRGTQNVQLTSITQLGTIRPIGYQFVPYFKLDIGKQAGRKRGGSGLAPRGRRRVLARLPA